MLDRPEFAEPSPWHELLFDALNAAGNTVVLVTHEAEIAAHTARQVLLRDGVVVSDRRRGDGSAPPPAGGG